MKNQGKDCCGDDCAACEDCGSGLRNRYFAGKRNTPDAQRVEQDYQIARRRLINQAMHGWGVVYGYGFKPDEEGGPGFSIGAGLAFDKLGRELLLEAESPLRHAEVLTLPGGEGECWLLSVHYAERRMSPVWVRDECRCERQQWDHVCETVRFSLRQLPCGACCEPQPCGLACACASGPCCDPLNADARSSEAPAMPRDGARCCICDHLAQLAPEGQCAVLSEGEEEGVRVDLANGVALACVRVQANECGTLDIVEIVDACGPRRTVKRNDLLFDLIRGCDLTRISAISWAAWHRASERVAWAEFDACFAATGNPKQGCITTLRVEFSRSVRRDTLRPDCFGMVFHVTQREGGWLEQKHAPIVRIDPEGGDDTLAEAAVLVVDWGWVRDALRSVHTEFERPGVRVEITVRGDFILDCNGQALDANPRGLLPAPSGNGTPGGTFVSTFELDRKPTPDEAQPSFAGDELGGTLA